MSDTNQVEWLTASLEQATKNYEKVQSIMVRRGVVINSLLTSIRDAYALIGRSEDAMKDPETLDAWVILQKALRDHE